MFKNDIAALLKQLEKEKASRKEAQEHNEFLKARLARSRLELMRELREQGWQEPSYK